MSNVKNGSDKKNLFYFNSAMFTATEVYLDSFVLR